MYPLASLLLTFSLAWAADVPPEPSSTTNLAALDWLAGCWQTDGDADQLGDEQWMGPQGGLMLGMGRTLKSGRWVDFEAMRIEQRGEGLVFVAKPAHKPEGVFPLSESAERSVVFSNPSHGFPQNIAYRRDGDVLLAAIFGEKDGQARWIDYSMHRVNCR